MWVTRSACNAPAAWAACGLWRLAPPCAERGWLLQGLDGGRAWCVGYGAVSHFCCCGCSFSLSHGSCLPRLIPCSFPECAPMRCLHVNLPVRFLWAQHSTASCRSRNRMCAFSCAMRWACPSGKGEPPKQQCEAKLASPCSGQAAELKVNKL